MNKDKKYSKIRFTYKDVQKLIRKATKEAQLDILDLYEHSFLEFLKKGFKGVSNIALLDLTRNYRKTIIKKDVTISLKEK